MTNTEKYLCKQCGKMTFVPIENPTGVPKSLEDVKLPPSMKGLYMAFDHQHKARKFIEALESRYLRVDLARRYKAVKFVLSDTDIMGRRFKLEHMRKSGVKRFFVYPHAARPDLVNDIHPEWAFTTAHFVVSAGHAEVMERFGYSRPVIPVGWSLCPIREFRPRAQARKVLFAPIHPRCSPVDQDVNRETFKRLEKLARADDIELTVRFVRSLPESGLERVEHPNIKYTVGTMDQGYEQIDGADVVVAHQTFHWIAVARGVPAVAMAEDMPTHVQVRNAPVLWARNWRKYRDLLCYPLDILATGDVLGLLQRAATCDEPVRDWRKRMIGSQFRRKRFIEKLEEYL
jgi:hypothetical protein